MTASDFNITTIGLGLLAGVVLFLYGVDRLAEGLRAVAGDRMKSILSRSTATPLAGVATGAIATTILDSSSVTIITVIALVSAGLLSFAQSVGVIMGANIGTAVSSQLIATNLHHYVPLALLAGFGLYWLGRSVRLKLAGQVVLGLGLIFFGLDQMGAAVAPLKAHAVFIEQMKHLESPLWGAFIGAATTAVLQSSSATLGIVITLAGQGLLTLPAGVAVMLSAEIGTCADTLIASLGRTRAALRAGLFHLLFNIVSAALGLLLVDQLVRLAQWVSHGAEVARQIANAQMIFNVAGVLLCVWFAPRIARGLERLLPDQPRQPAAPALCEEPAHLVREFGWVADCPA